MSAGYLPAHTRKKRHVDDNVEPSPGWHQNWNKLLKGEEGFWGLF